VNFLIVSLVCLLPMAGEPRPGQANDSTKAETPDDTSPDLLRTWTARTGDQQVEAEFIRVKGASVYLRKKDGKIATVAIEKLCEADQRWLFENTTTVDDFEWESGIRLPRAVANRKKPVPRIVHRLECRPLVITLAKDDPIRFALHWTRAWHVPAHDSQPEIYRPIPDSGIPAVKVDTLRSLKIHFFTPAGRRYKLQATMQDNEPEAPLWDRLGNTLYLTMTEEALTEAAHVRGEWTSGKIAGFHDLGRYSIKVEGSLVPLGKTDVPIPFESEFFHVQRVADGRKTLAEIESMARARVVEVCGVAHTRGLPGRAVATTVGEWENGNRVLVLAVSGGRASGETSVMVELTPQGNSIRVGRYPLGKTRGDRLFCLLFPKTLRATTIWPVPTEDR
jgi:hypothetical protein